MSATYKRAGKDVLGVVAAVMKEAHGDLVTHKVAVDVIMADGGQDKNGVRKLALRHHGRPAAGLMRVTKQKERAAGMRDAVMILDLATWEKLSGLSREALVDHELRHVRLRDVLSDDECLRDSSNRPILDTVPHDWEMGGFSATVERYQRNSLEAQMLAHVLGQDQVQEGFAQLEFRLASTAAGAETDEAGSEPTADEVELTELFALGGDLRVFMTVEGTAEVVAPEDGEGAGMGTGGGEAGGDAGAGAGAGGQMQDPGQPGLAVGVDDEMVERAIAIIRETRRASTSAIQRRLKIGFTRASRVMDILEERGVVGPTRGAEPREILIDLDHAAA